MATEQIVYQGKLPVTEGGNGPKFPGMIQERDVDGDGNLEYEPFHAMVLYERQISTGLYLPPGVVSDHTDIGKPRVNDPDLQTKIQEIIDNGVTLNGSIDSIFSYGTVSAKVLVSAGSIVSPYGASIAINDYKKLFCVAKEVTQTAHDFDILAYWSTSTGSYLNTDVYNINHYSNLTRQFDVISHRVEIKLRNNDTVDHEYFIELGGVR